MVYERYERMNKTHPQFKILRDLLGGRKLRRHEEKLIKRKNN